MLELKNINKSYKTGNFVQHALKNVDLSFRKNEFVAILGFNRWLDANIKKTL